uniref:Uncharacterized protein n=1 Tax=viral metagenome TaxID=1070528 RepID=A0A6C0HIQ2_9ZZZZ
MNSLEDSLPPRDNESPLEKIANSLLIKDSTPSQIQPQQSQQTQSLLDWKTIIILVLIILMVLMYLGINFLTLIGSGLQSVVNVTQPAVSKIAAAFGYTAGESINQTAEVASDTIVTGVEVAEGVVKDLGNLLIDASEEADPSNRNSRLQAQIESKNKPHARPDPSADTSENPIQNPIFSGKRNWCLVGEHQFKRGCVSISESDKCLSGQVFPNQQMCLNPTFSK